MRFLEEVPQRADRQVGDMWYVCQMWKGKHDCWACWSNCSGKHLIVLLPNMGFIDLMGRADNCTMKDDKTHRCWIVHGEPPNITVDKNGETCKAGAGSIVVGDWHGFIRNGEFVKH